MQDFTQFIANHLELTYTLAGLLVLLMIVEFLRLKRNNFLVNVKQAVHLINRENALIIDLRSKDIFKTGHIVDAQTLSPQDILTTPKKIEKYKNRPIILVDGTGADSQKIAAKMIKEGYNIYTLSGGIRSWKEAEMPLVKE
jgi:rhodanese-related sulfurtransferase